MIGYETVRARLRRRKVVRTWRRARPLAVVLAVIGAALVTAPLLNQLWPG